MSFEPDLFTPRTQSRPARALPEPPIIPNEVEELFERFAFELIRRGFKRYSSDAILHRIRWHFHVDKGNREYKCNDHWTPYLARWFMRKFPEHREFFETRVQKSLGEQ